MLYVSFCWGCNKIVGVNSFNWLDIIIYVYINIELLFVVIFNRMDYILF